jgi:hypothetical protein
MVCCPGTEFIATVFMRDMVAGFNLRDIHMVFCSHENICLQ